MRPSDVGASVRESAGQIHRQSVAEIRQTARRHLDDIWTTSENFAWAGDVL
jgi:hypothetical protein